MKKDYKVNQQKDIKDRIHFTIFNYKFKWGSAKS